MNRSVGCCDIQLLAGTQGLLPSASPPCTQGEPVGGQDAWVDGFSASVVLSTVQATAACRALRITCNACVCVLEHIFRYSCANTKACTVRFHGLNASGDHAGRTWPRSHPLLVAEGRGLEKAADGTAARPLLPLAGCVPMDTARKGQPCLGSRESPELPHRVISGHLDSLQGPHLYHKLPHVHVLTCAYIFKKRGNTNVIATVSIDITTAITKYMSGASYMHVTFLRY